MDDTYLSTQYDAAFSGVKNHFTWLPWVGCNYPQRHSNQRLLVVGESYYKGEDSPEELEQEDSEWTRKEITKCLLNIDDWGRTYDNISRLFFKVAFDDIDSLRFWSDTVFYNFVQKPMQDKDDRPTGEDFHVGWKVFAEVVRIIQPSHCLFIGVSAAWSFDDSMRSQNIPFDPVVFMPGVGQIQARKAKLENTELCFVQHTAHHFSWSKWHDWLQANQPELMSWLQAESYTTIRNA